MQHPTMILQDQAVTEEVYSGKRAFFDAGKTKTIDFRLLQLERLEQLVRSNEERILVALAKDLGKPTFEAYTSEIGVLYQELREAKKQLARWMEPKRVATPLVLQPSKSFIRHDPLGVVLIIGPWNYPFQLLLAPVIGAIAAGNCIVLKPSDLTPHTSGLIAELIAATFDPDYISVVLGDGAVVGDQLLDRFRFDHVFFTGSPGVGRHIAVKTAAKLVPTTLELGGKSPVIVDKSANLQVTAKRIVWSKFFNAGQTCVCPDYLLVEETVKDALIQLLKAEIRRAFGADPQMSESYGRIINERRVHALQRLMQQGTIVHGGRIDLADRYVEPTLLDAVSLEDDIMHEEIFAPLLPIVSFSSAEQAVSIIRRNRYPLALYLYTESSEMESYFLEHVEFGGGCINNGMVHLMNAELPFGGVGGSGMGAYHGRHTFETFSHTKSIVKTSTKLDPSLRYAPYTSKKMTIAKRYFAR